jgi:hypothetical protein
LWDPLFDGTVLLSIQCRRAASVNGFRLHDTKEKYIKLKGKILSILVFKKRSDIREAAKIYIEIPETELSLKARHLKF